MSALHLAHRNPDEPYDPAVEEPGDLPGESSRVVRVSRPPAHPGAPRIVRFGRLVARSPQMIEAFRMLEAAAQSDSAVLVVG